MERQNLFMLTDKQCEIILDNQRNQVLSNIKTGTEMVSHFIKHVDTENKINSQNHIAVAHSYKFGD